MRLAKLILAVIALTGSAVAQSATDRYGSSDHPLLERYPRAWIVNYSQEEAPDYRWALGALEKVNGVVTAEQEKRASGKLTRISYRVPPGVAPGEVMRFMTSQLQDKAATQQFSCEGRACGSSHQWANQVFGYAKLYGVERTQYYSAWQRDNQLISLYAVQRGNKRVYLHLDLLQQVSDGPAVPQMDGLVDQLQKQGYVRWPEQSRQPPLLAWLRAEGSTVWLVGHLLEEGDVEVLQARSLAMANEVAATLRQAGLESTQIRTFGVGALAPGLVQPGEGAVFLVLKP